MVSESSNDLRNGRFEEYSSSLLSIKFESLSGWRGVKNEKGIRDESLHSVALKLQGTVVYFVQCLEFSA